MTNEEKKPWEPVEGTRFSWSRELDNFIKEKRKQKLEGLDVEKESKEDKYIPVTVTLSQALEFLRFTIFFEEFYAVYRESIKWSVDKNYEGFEVVHFFSRYMEWYEKKHRIIFPTNASFTFQLLLGSHGLSRLTDGIDGPTARRRLLEVEGIVNDGDKENGG